MNTDPQPDWLPTSVTYRIVSSYNKGVRYKDIRNGYIIIKQQIILALNRVYLKTSFANCTEIYRNTSFVY